MLPLSEGLALGPFLCKMLQCCPARLSSKIRKGKKIFHLKRGPSAGAELSPAEIKHYRCLQEKVSDTEHLFLNKIAESCDPEDAAVLSYHIQHAWVKEFIESAQGKLVKDKLQYHSAELAVPPFDSIAARGSTTSIHNWVQISSSDNKHFSRLWAMAGPSVAAWTGEKNAANTRLLEEFRAANAQFASSGEFGLAARLHCGTAAGDDGEVLEASDSLKIVMAQFTGKEATSAVTFRDFECLFRNHGDLVRAMTANDTGDGGDNSASSSSLSSSSSSVRIQAHRRVVELQLADSEYICVCVVEVLFVVRTVSLSSLRFRQRDGYEHVFGDGGGSTTATFRSTAVSQMLSSAHAAAAELEDHNMHKKRRLEHSKQQSSSHPARGLVKAPELTVIQRAVEKTGAGESSGNDAAADAVYSARSISLQRACGPFLLTSDRHQLTQHSSSTLSPGGMSLRKTRERTDSGVGSDSGDSGVNSLAMIRDGIEFVRTSSGVSHQSLSTEGEGLIEEVLEREPVVNIVYTGHIIGQRESRRRRGAGRPYPLLSSAATADKPTLLSATSTVGAPVTSSSAAAHTSSRMLAKFTGRDSAPTTSPTVPLSFDAILQSFLRVIPFHVIEIWVPVQLEHGGTVLLYGGSAALDKELLGWSNYSRNFSFNPDVGLPGRVAAGGAVESSNDVSKLPVPQFLRAEMAGELGIHAACGLPFFTGNKCDAVVVFYSRHVFEPSKELMAYMGNVCESLNIRAHIRVLQQEQQESAYK